MSRRLPVVLGVEGASGVSERTTSDCDRVRAGDDGEGDGIAGWSSNEIDRGRGRVGEFGSSSSTDTEGEFAGRVPCELEPRVNRESRGGRFFNELSCRLMSSSLVVGRIGELPLIEGDGGYEGIGDCDEDEDMGAD